MSLKPRVLTAGVLATAMTAAAAAPARAVIIGPGDGTTNRLPASPPAGVPWQNVGGFVNGAGPASVTYLGNRYVLMANHTGVPIGNSITFPGVAGSFGLDGVTDTRLKNPSDNTDSDLRLMRLSADPGLPAVTLPTAGVSPATGITVTMIGNGRIRNPSPTYYNVTAGPTWTSTTNGATATAAVFSGTRTNGSAFTWGTNTNDGVANGGLPSALNTVVFQTDFYESGPSVDVTAAKTDYRTRVLTLGETTPEASAVEGDSGGGVFGPGGVLLGTMTTVDGFTNQPTDATVIGARTFISDLSVYRSQLPANVPEPTSALLLPAAAGLLALRRRHRRI